MMTTGFVGRNGAIPLLLVFVATMMGVLQTSTTTFTVVLAGEQEPLGLDETFSLKGKDALVTSQEGAATECHYYSGYPTVCSNVTGCSYCCANQTCVSTGSALTVCPEAGAILPSGTNVTCADLCAVSGAGSQKEICRQCTKKSWCLFCAEDNSCYSDRSDECGASMYQQCELEPVSDEDEMGMTKRILNDAIYVAIGLGGLCILVPLVKYVHSKIKSRIAVRRDAERRREFRARMAERRGAEEGGTSIQEEQQPLLGGNREGDAHAPRGAEGEDKPKEEEKKEDEDQKGVSDTESDEGEIPDEETCQLCLEKLASIVYLPCYHCYCCEDCSSKLRPAYRRSEGTGVSCPFCRQRVRAMVSVKPLHPLVAASLKNKKDQ